nr:unnamed protein product [Digitaria exilis]
MPVVSRDQLIVEHDVRGLIYLEACIRKAFWLHTYNPPRVAMVDTTIANVTPKGSQVGNPGCGRTRSSFTPSVTYRRWLPWQQAEEPGRSRGSPSASTRRRRGCTGLSLGMLITVMLLARQLQGFGRQ